MLETFTSAGLVALPVSCRVALLLIDSYLAQFQPRQGPSFPAASKPGRWHTLCHPHIQHLNHRKMTLVTPISATPPGKQEDMSRSSWVPPELPAASPTGALLSPHHHSPLSSLQGASSPCQGTICLREALNPKSGKTEDSKTKGFPPCHLQHSELGPSYFKTNVTREGR